MEEIETIGVGGVHYTFQFQVETEIDEDGERVIYRVFEIPEQPRFYIHTFRVINDGLWRSEVMDAMGFEQFRQRGIPEAIIQRASIDRQVSIESSANNGVPGEFMTPNAQAAWQRLVAMNNNAVQEPVRFILNFVAPATE